MHDGPKEEILARHFNALCLSGEGKGRIHWFQQSHSFRYESLLKDDSWQLLLNFPFQESLVLDLKRPDSPDGPVGAGGNLLSYLKDNFNLPSTEKKLLDDAIGQLGQFIEAVHKVRAKDFGSTKRCRWKNPGKKLLCQVGEKRLTFLLTESAVKLLVNSPRRSSLLVGLFQFNGNYFQEMSLWTLRGKVPTGFRVEFFLNNCEHK